MNLAVFDFDGTLTTKDSLFEFLKFYFSSFKVYAGLILLSPVLIGYVLKLVPNWRAKEILLTFFFKSTPIETFQATCDKFSRQGIPAILREEAIDKLRHHQQQGDRTIIISASPENWLRSWCDLQGVELVATRLQTTEGRITGKIAGKNCYGAEKVRRLKELLEPKEYRDIYAYGDSSGDKELLRLATRPFYRRF